MRVCDIKILWVIIEQAGFLINGIIDHPPSNCVIAYQTESDTAGLSNGINPAIFVSINRHLFA